MTIPPIIPTEPLYPRPLPKNKRRPAFDIDRSEQAPRSKEAHTAERAPLPFATASIRESHQAARVSLSPDLQHLRGAVSYASRFGYKPSRTEEDDLQSSDEESTTQLNVKFSQFRV